jgi:branched-chain amino acid transport system substrate-binding protein
MAPGRSRLLASSLVVLAGTLLAGCGARIPDTIRIGVAQPLSGPSAARGQDLVNGALLAATDLNASNYKVGGKAVKIEIVAMDDKADKEEAKKVAHAMVEQKVVAVIGHLSSDVTEAVIPVYSSGNVPQLFTSSASELTKLGAGNAFRLIASDELQAQAIASYAAGTLKAGRVAILYEDTAYGAPLAKGATAALAQAGRKVELSQAVDNKTTSFGAFIGQLKATRPDVLLAMVRDHQLLPLFEQMNAAGLGELPVVAASVARTQRLVTSATVKRVYVTSGSAEVGEFKGGEEFARKFRDAYRSEPVWAAHYAYDAVWVVADTIRRAGSVDAAALRAKLKTIDAIAPVTTTMRFNADGEQRYGAVGVYEKRDSRWLPLVRSDSW